MHDLNGWNELYNSNAHFFNILTEIIILEQSRGNIVSFQGCVDNFLNYVAIEHYECSDFKSHNTIWPKDTVPEDMV